MGWWASEQEGGWTDDRAMGDKGFSGFFPLRGCPPPPTPLTENHFAKKPLAERGGVPPPPLTKIAENFPQK